MRRRLGPVPRRPTYSDKWFGVRAAQQLGVLPSLPPLGIVASMSFNVITPALRLALGLSATLLVVDLLPWPAVQKQEEINRCRQR
jgi:hypothetical protein